MSAFEADAIESILPATASVNAADFTRTRREIRVRAGTTMADLMRPGFWRQRVAQIDTGDILEVVTPDYALDAELRVVGKEKGLLYVRVLRAFEREERTVPATSEPVAIPEIPANYLVNHTPKTGWRVWTKSPSEEIKRDLKTKLEAAQYAIEHDRRARGE